MTYSIIAISNADVLATYASLDEALANVAAAQKSDSATVDELCVVAFDDDGRPTAALDGNKLRDAIVVGAADAELVA